MALALGVAGCGDDDAAETPTQPPPDTSASADPIEGAQDALQSSEEKAAEERAEARRRAQEAAAAEREAEAQRRRSREAARRAAARERAQERARRRAEAQADAAIIAARNFYLATDDDAVQLDQAIADAQNGLAGSGPIRSIRAKIESRANAYALEHGIISTGANLLMSLATQAADAADAGDLAGMADARGELFDARAALADEAINP